MSFEESPDCESSREFSKASWRDRSKISQCEARGIGAEIDQTTRSPKASPSTGGARSALQVGKWRLAGERFLVVGVVRRNEARAMEGRAECSRAQSTASEAFSRLKAGKAQLVLIVLRGED